MTLASWLQCIMIDLLISSRRATFQLLAFLGSKIPLLLDTLFLFVSPFTSSLAVFLGFLYDPV